jgi:hypothetical protein
MGSVTVERRLNIPLEKVWSVAGDFTKSPDPFLPITIVKEGEDSNRIGCERQIKSGKAIFHERLVAIDPPNSLTYIMLSGAPVKQYLGKVALFAEGDITLIKWTAVFTAKVPGTGWIIKMTTKKNFNKFIDELEKIK